MKTANFWKWIPCLAMAALPLAGRGEPIAGSSAAAAVPVVQPIADAASITNAASPEEAERNLENAKGEMVSTVKAPANVRLSATAGEVVKLAQAGVDDSVLMAYVTNSIYTFKLSSDDIIYLNDLGVPGTVVTAMIQRDEALRPGTAAPAGGPPAYSNQIASLPGAPAAYPTPRAAAEMEQMPPPETEVVPYAEAQPPVNASYTYFYDSLAPYGNWIDVGGYGPCWRPTVTVVNPGWQPYCDRGHWVYSDCGWYWASDYSWGWAPFHYGRWFRHNQWGWCWAPDTVWGPSWVSWRYSQNYCGWAPLPPTACWGAGVGFTYYGNPVGFNFGFGLPYSCYTFVPSYYFCDPHPSHHTVPHHSVAEVFQQTVTVNEVVADRHHRAVNRGIPVGQIASATRMEIHPVPIHDAQGPASTRRAENGRTIPAYRPDFPQPAGRVTLAGQGVPASPRPIRNFGSRASANPATPTGATMANRSRVPAGEEVRPEISAVNPEPSPVQRTEPAIIRIPNRSASSPQRNPGGSRIFPVPAANNSGQSPTVNPSTQLPPPEPAQAIIPPARNNTSTRSVTIGSPQRRFTPAASQQSPPPTSVAPAPASTAQRSTRWEAPRFQQQDQRSFPQSQPATPSRSFPAQPSLPAPAQSPRATEWRPQPWANPPAQRAAPAPAPQNNSPAPRFDARSAPAPSAPATQPTVSSSRQGGGGNGSRQQRN